MTLISWNVNGLRAAWGKGFPDFLENQAPAVLAMQETRVLEGQLLAAMVAPFGYRAYWFPAVKKGYSGVGLYMQDEPLSIHRGIGNPLYDTEGRVITAEMQDFFLVNVYFPNSQHELVRLEYKLSFDAALLDYCEHLRREKPVVICGDFNVAHEERDLARPADNTMNPGFYIDERNWFSRLLEAGYIDTFRLFEQGNGHYSWWTYRANARARNVGWRIDYFVVSSELENRVQRAWIMSDVMGSDHCPVALELK